MQSLVLHAAQTHCKTQPNSELYNSLYCKLCVTRFWHFVCTPVGRYCATRKCSLPFNFYTFRYNIDLYTNWFEHNFCFKSLQRVLFSDFFLNIYKVIHPSIHYLTCLSLVGLRGVAVPISSARQVRSWAP